MAKISIIPPAPVEPDYRLDLTAAEAGALRDFLGAFKIANIDNENRDLRRIWNTLSEVIECDWSRHDHFFSKIQNYNK